jgi:hypothetical protein
MVADRGAEFVRCGRGRGGVDFGVGGLGWGFFGPIKK